MKIVICTINPLFADKVIGGSTKHLRRIAEALAERGHEVVVLCTRRDDSATVMTWGPKITVRPEFIFKQPFPLPYDIPAFQMARNIQAIVECLNDADRLYLHDGEFLFPPITRIVPTIVSLRDCVYPETMLGSFLFEADGIITLNQYCRDLLLTTAGQFLADLPSRCRIIHNGFDWNFFRPTPPSAEFIQKLGFDPAGYQILLHPHRPETNKGLKQTIEVVHKLKYKYGHTRLKVLIPHWFDADGTTTATEHLAAWKQQIAAHDLTDEFCFHGWLPQRLMPEYYSLGIVTLVLGSFVEAFGNSTYESLACGTPAIVSRVSSNRTLIPDELLPKVHFDDIDTAAQLADQLLRQPRRTSEAILRYMQEHFSIEPQCEAYCDAILNAKKLAPMRYRFAKQTPEQRWRLAPWCYLWGERVYHDFRASHDHEPQLAAWHTLCPAGANLTESNALGIGIDEATFARWQRLGYLCPSQG